MRNNDRTTEGCPKLVLLILRGWLRRIIKVVAAIELVVAQKIPCRSVYLVGPRFDDGVDNRPVPAPDFRAIRIRLDFEFLQSLDRGLNHKIGFVQEIWKIRIVVHAIEQEVVL